ncbi:uncharacterized protein LOC144616185 [Panthera onca]
MHHEMLCCELTEVEATKSQQPSRCFYTSLLRGSSPADGFTKHQQALTCPPATGPLPTVNRRLAADDLPSDTLSKDTFSPQAHNREDGCWQPKCHSLPTWNFSFPLSTYQTQESLWLYLRHHPLLDYSLCLGKCGYDWPDFGLLLANLEGAGFLSVW